MTTKRAKRLVYSWSTSQGRLAFIVFIALAILIEYGVVSAFINAGAMEGFTFEFVGIQLSLAFHIIPLNVVATLVICWIYLTKSLASVPSVFSMSRASKTRKTSRLKRKRSRGVDTQHFERLVVFWRRSHFGRFLVKSSIVMFSLFLFLIFLSYSAVCPTLLYEIVTHFYKENSFYRSFIEGTSRFISDLNISFGSASVSFASSLSNTIAPIGTVLVFLDPIYKYLFCQNMSTWISALIILIYGYFKNK